MNANVKNHLLNEVVVREIQFFIPIELNIILLCTCKKALQNINIQRENVNLFSYDLSKIKNKCNCILSIIYNMQLIKKKSYKYNAISFYKEQKCRFIQLNEKLSINRFNSLKIVLPNDNFNWIFEELGELKLKCRYEKHNENCSIKLKKKFIIRYRLSREYIQNNQEDNIPMYICEDCLLANALENIHL